MTTCENRAFQFTKSSKITNCTWCAYTILPELIELINLLLAKIMNDTTIFERSILSFKILYRNSNSSNFSLTMMSIPI